MSSKNKKETPQEKEARTCFEKHLVRRFGRRSVQYWVVEHDPPDYLFEIRGLKYSVEATTIVNEVEVRKVNGNRGKVPSMALSGNAERLERELQQVTAKSGILRGYYVLALALPFDPSATRKHISDPALEYVRRTKGVKQADLCEIRLPPRRLPDGTETGIPGRRIASIKKISMRRDLLQVLPPPQAAWAQPAREEATSRLQNVIAEKAEKLCSNDAPEPWILLVLHRDPFVEHTFYKQLVSGLSGVDQFHSIFIARNSQQGYFLSGPWREQDGGLHKLGVEDRK